jgi:hypothetical protein
MYAAPGTILETVRAMLDRERLRVLAD